jgi:hypothetical protein
LETAGFVEPVLLNALRAVESFNFGATSFAALARLAWLLFTNLSAFFSKLQK